MLARLRWSRRVQVEIAGMLVTVGECRRMFDERGVLSAVFYARSVDLPLMHGRRRTGQTRHCVRCFSQRRAWGLKVQRISVVRRGQRV